jgi:uncharacterized damage-inducible protein DinB
VDTTEFNKQCWAQEYGHFRKTIAAAAPDQLDWQPDPKSRSARRLIGHIIGHVQDLTELVDAGVIHHRNEVAFDTLDDALEIFDRSYEEMQARLATLDAAGWAQPAEFLAGDFLVMKAPREQLAWIFLFDAIQHRGQLTTHLRPTGRKVPALYGPSADEQMAASASH